MFGAESSWKLRTFSKRSFNVKCESELVMSWSKLYITILNYFSNKRRCIYQFEFKRQLLETVVVDDQCLVQAVCKVENVLQTFFQ
jgi:hypothetical protein